MRRKCVFYDPACTLISAKGGPRGGGSGSSVSVSLALYRAAGPGCFFAFFLSEISFSPTLTAIGFSELLVLTVEAVP